MRSRNFRNKRSLNSSVSYNLPSSQETGNSSEPTEITSPKAPALKASKLQSADLTIDTDFPLPSSVQIISLAPCDSTISQNYMISFSIPKLL